MSMTEQALVDTEPQILQLRVYNFNTFDIVDRFDGTLYTLEQRSHKDYPVDAAFHIFGWHKDADMAMVRRHCEKRFGWNTPAMVGEGRNELFFSNLKFRPIFYRMVAEVEDDEQPPETDELDGATIPPRPPAKPRRNTVMEAANESAARHG